MSQELKPKYHLLNLCKLEPASPSWLAAGGGVAHYLHAEESFSTGYQLITYTQKRNPSAQCASATSYHCRVCRPPSVGFEKHHYSPDNIHYMNTNINQKYWHALPVVTTA